MTERAGRVRLLVAAALVLAGAALVLLDYPASLTDEDDYMPYALADLLAGRNPYATRHAEARTYATPWGDVTYAWETTFPYLPTIAMLQLPAIDYRWTALAAYGALLLAFRDRPPAFFAFGNPLVLWLAASGFNDFVPLALLAWAERSGRAWISWLACGAKQFVLPLLAVQLAWRREWRALALATAATAAIVAPFLLLDPGAFVSSAVLAHLDKAQRVAVHWNYFLYPLYLGVTWRPRNVPMGAPG